MKTTSRLSIQHYWPYALILGLAILFFFLGNPLAARFFYLDGRPILGDINLPEESKQVMYHLDKFNPYDDKGHLYSLQGWAFTTDKPGSPTDDYATQIILLRDEGNLVYPTTAESREDVISHFKELNLDIQMPGFSVLINKEILRRGEYQVGILLTLKEDGSQHFILTDRLIKRTPNSITLIPKSGD